MDCLLATYVPREWNTVEPGYNDIGLYDTSPIASDFLWYQFLIIKFNVILLG